MYMYMYILSASVLIRLHSRNWYSVSMETLCCHVMMSFCHMITDWSGWYMNSKLEPYTLMDALVDVVCFDG